jgi:hypothetical protein
MGLAGWPVDGVSLAAILDGNRYRLQAVPGSKALNQLAPRASEAFGGLVAALKASRPGIAAGPAFLIEYRL